MQVMAYQKQEGERERERETHRYRQTERQRYRETEREREKYAQNKSDRKVCNRTEVSSAINNRVQPDTNSEQRSINRLLYLVDEK